MDRIRKLAKECVSRSPRDMRYVRRRHGNISSFALGAGLLRRANYGFSEDIRTGIYEYESTINTVGKRHAGPPNNPPH